MNIKLFRKEDKIICVPYDFDFSGLVNASYAVPDNSYGIKSVRERIFLGFSDDIKELENSIQIMERAKEDIFNITKKIALLSRKNKNKTVDYLKSFYEDINYRRVERINLNTKIVEEESSK